MIKAKVIQDSISKHGNRLTTFELEYPRFIHSEFLTHRAFSRNAASSRAIPAKSMRDFIRSNTPYPTVWGKNAPGMQSRENLRPEDAREVRDIWNSARDAALIFSAQLDSYGVHKQIVNRLVEPFTHMKVICSATELDNFFELRDHPDADPTFQELAFKMRLAYNASVPINILAGEWHVPYVTRLRNNETGRLEYFSNGRQVALYDARMISASCCAQVSYRKNDTSIEKARNIFDRLINSKPMHASPVEHQATPITSTKDPGITHVSVDGTPWSGNFRGWTQFRQLL